MKYSIGLFALAALLTSSSAHMEMVTPKPYGQSTLNNSPLDASGSDFPCKQRPGVYDAEGASNVMAIGEPQTLSFKGGATHGGGSCQVSLTTDLQPTKDSKWMVIKSIEGGCPTDADGNVGNDANALLPTTFQYTIPEGIAPGEYTIAWTWFNRIGNREMYMNCGPATVTGSKKKRYAPASNPQIRRQTSFPAMYVANLKGINSCTTEESVNYVFPDPGGDVTTGSSRQTTNLDASCMGGSASVSPSQPQPGSGSSASASVPSATGGSGSPSPTGSGTAPSGSPGVFASAASSAPATVPTGQPDAPAPATPLASSAAAPAAPASSGTSGSSPASSSSSASGSQTAGSPCSDEGAWACSSDNSSFQRCASGMWSVPMAVPQGMTASCSGSSFSMVASGGGKMKRVVRKSVGLFDRYDN